MKTVTLLAVVDSEKCVGCRVCEKVCPVLAIKVDKASKKATVNNRDCRGCANCEQRCPHYAISMIKREEPFTVGVNTENFDKDKIREICLKANMNPEQVICYCVGVRAEEVAASLLAGAKTPEEVSLMTGIRTGCTIECIQPILRLVEAAGFPLIHNNQGWQWYGRTVTAWDIPDEVNRKYSSRGFYFDEDKKLMDLISHKTRREGD